MIRAKDAIRRFEPATWGLVLAVAYASLVSLYRAPQRPFDFDELATVAVAGGGSPGAIWRALESAADANPPLFYLLEALGSRLAFDPHVGYRLPTILGFVGVPLALFAVVRSRCGSLAGLAAALVPFVTMLFTFYPLEARPYTLVAGLVAWAWVMWQQGDRRGHAIGLGALLAAATAVHYYAVFSIVPFGLAELTRTLRLRERRVRVWLALAAAFAPLVAFWPLLSQFSQQYRGAFWARPQLITPYAELVGMSDRWAAPLVLLLIVAVVANALRARAGPARRGASTIAPEDWAMVFAFIALPVVIFAVAQVVGISMVGRYAITAVLGIAAGAAMVAFHAGGRTGASWLIAATLLVGGLQQLEHFRYGGVLPNTAADHGDLARLRALVRKAEVAALPVAVSNGLRYLPMAYYAGASPQLSFLYLADTATAIKIIGTDSIDRALVSLSPLLPIRLEERSAFLAANPRFLVFSENEYWDWLTPALLSEGHSVRLVASDSSDGTSHMLFLVESGKASPAAGK